MKAGLVHRLGRHEAEAAEHLGADGDPEQRPASVKTMPLAGA